MDTAAISVDSKTMQFELDEEFYARVKHNFKSYVLLTSKSRNWREDVILSSIFRLNGYKSHKTVRYGGISSHIHVKFHNDYKAKEALKFLNEMSSDLTAVLVDDLLRDWFNYEVKSGFGPPCTLTVVDILGKPPLSLNFLTSNILNSIFKDFGCPYLLPYTAALDEPHVQVMFGSMTESLAACMAFGEWYERNEKVDSFCYRVRINPSEKEAKLIIHSGGAAEEAFKLDYFLNMRKELPHNSKRSGIYKKQDKMDASNASKSKGARKGRKQNFVPKDTQNSTTNQFNNHAPILCLPIIAPLNNISEAFVTSRQLGSEFANAILNFQMSCSISTQSAVATNHSETEIPSAIQYDSSANLERDNKDLNCLSKENNFAVDFHQTKDQMSLVPVPKQVESFSYRDHRKRWQSRVFERRT